MLPVRAKKIANNGAIFTSASETIGKLRGAGLRPFVLYSGPSLLIKNVTASGNCLIRMNSQQKMDV
jgi:hypothetical protein